MKLLTGMIVVRKGRVLRGLTALLLFLMSPAPAPALTLSEGIREAVEKSRLVRMSRGDESIALDEALIDRAKMLPHVSARVSGTSMAYQPGAVFDVQSVPTAERNFLSYGLDVKQMLYDFAGNASRYEAGLQRVTARQFETRRMRNIAAIEFALAFFDLLDAKRMIAVAEKEAERLEAHLRDTRSLFEMGVITRNDLLQAEVRLSDARQRLLSARNSGSVAASRVNNSLQRPLGADIGPVDLDPAAVDRLASAVGGLDLEPAWAVSEAKRPELLMADATLRSLEFSERARKAGYYPKLFLRAGYDHTENRYQVHESNWQATLGLSFDIFSGGAVTAEVAKVAHQRERLMEDRRRLAESIRLEVQRFFLDAQSARERVAVTRDAVQQAEENLRINKVRYREGVGTATEVLDAVSLLSIAETNYYHAMYDLAKAEISVRYAMGEDLVEVSR